MDPIAITALILVAAVIAFVSGKIPVGVVAVGVSVALWATGILPLADALAGFGDPTVIFIGTLFIVSEGLDSTGVTAWAGQQVLTYGGGGRRRLLTMIALLVAVLTALISVNGAVAALIPVAVVVAARAALPPSQVLMPVAFAAHAGSMLALTGTPVNIIVSEGAFAAGARRFTFFEFAAVGVPLVLGALGIILWLGPKLLPKVEAASLPPDISAYARRLRKDYQLPAEMKLMGVRRGSVEVVVPPHSRLVGSHLFIGQATPSGDLMVLGILRHGEELISREATVMAGDVILLSGPWEHLERHTDTDAVLAVARPQTLRRGVPLGGGAKRALVILGAMVILLATGVVPPAIAGLLAAGAMILSGVLTAPRAYRAVSWTTVLIVAGMIPLSTAFATTGTADLIASQVLTFLGDAPPTVALLVMCVITMALGQLISNTATVLIMVPIATVMAAGMEVSVLPFMMALAVAGAASFLTPVATAANTMVLEPGGYRFGDYWKFGLPFVGLFLAIAVLWVPVIWPF